jgi:hypothetical protein
MNGVGSSPTLGATLHKNRFMFYNSMNENKDLVAAEIKEIESRIELNKAHADLLRAQTAVTR